MIDQNVEFSVNSKAQEKFIRIADAFIVGQWIDRIKNLCFTIRL
jgi:hypothetical protein